MKIKNVEPTYTGGWIYIFLGELNDGTFFIAESDNYDVRIVDCDPSPTFWDSDGGASYPEWQEEHLVRDLDVPDKYNFCLKMFKWIKKHNPIGNYSPSDIDMHIAFVKQELS